MNVPTLERPFLFGDVITDMPQIIMVIIINYIIICTKASDSKTNCPLKMDKLKLPDFKSPDVWEYLWKTGAARWHTDRVNPWVDSIVYLYACLCLLQVIFHSYSSRKQYHVAS